MVQEIKMPSAGQTTDEATIVAVNVKVGDTVKRGDVIVEAETDKAVLPVECFTSGKVLDVLVKVGDSVDAGTVLVAVGKEGDTYSRSGAPKAVAPAPASAPVSAPEPVKASVGTEIKMPSAGQTTDEAKIVAVNVKVGDTVKRGDVLVEAETDKAVLPVESFAAGQVLDVLVSVGDPVTAGSVLVVVGKPEQAAAYSRATAAPAVEPSAAKPAAPVTVQSQEEYMPIVKGYVSKAPAAAPRNQWSAMPNAKMLAKEMGVPLDQLSPSNGLFLKRQDVLAYHAPEVTTPAAEIVHEKDYEVMTMTSVRKVISRRMLESAQTIPAWQCTISVNMTACMEMKANYQNKLGVKLSYNDILAKAIAVASQKYNLVNARFENDEVRIFKHTNIGLAVGLEGTLLVPVVKNIDTMGLVGISKSYRELVKKARDGRLGPADMGCGSITISNLGMFDVDQFVAIVNPPESCILAVGKITVQPVWNGTEFTPVHMMNITGSFDHRIIDGAYGAQFLRELKNLLETPALMLS